MSAKSLAQLAVDRDITAPGQSVVKDSTDVLVAAVPTEALAAYTAVIGVVLAANIGSSYMPFRWSAYGAFIVLAVLAPFALFKHSTMAIEGGRALPILECLTAGVAAAAWGLVMPGSPLTMIFKGNALVFATTAIVVGTGAIIGLATQRLGTANGKTPVAKAAPALEANTVLVPAGDAAPVADAGPAQVPEADAAAKADGALSAADEARVPVAPSGTPMPDGPSKYSPQFPGLRR